MTRPRPQPLIAVRDVPASSRWYAQLLGVDRMSARIPSGHGDHYDRLLAGDDLIMQLHAWDVDDHVGLSNPDAGPLGHGVLIWFEVDDFDDAVARARMMSADIVEEPHVNPAPKHREIWIRDPDGHIVVLCSPDGEALTAAGGG